MNKKTYEEPELNVGDFIGRVKKERINIPLLRSLVRPEATDETIMTEAMKLDDYDYDALEESAVLTEYQKQGKPVAGKSFEERLQFRDSFMSQYGDILNRMQNRLAGE